MRFLIIFASVFFLALVPGTALAGSCPVCTTSADCTSFEDGGVAFCVLHDSDVGCGAELMICCPGQGCAVGESGRPSCEGTSCTVVGESIPDGGPTGSDGGPTGSDGGPLSDGGPTSDGGSMGTDGGRPTTTGRRGCGCVVAKADDAGEGAMVLGAMLVLVWARARRRR